jgi:hypothetical protein
MRSEKLWAKQYRAKQGIRKRFGAKSALYYLTGEKPLMHAHGNPL